MHVAIVTGRPSETDRALAARRWGGSRATLLSPKDALLFVRAGDVALSRLRVRETLDGVEDGSWELERLAEAGATVLNRPSAVLACHDKLVTARKLRLAGLPQPRTVLLDADRRPPDLDLPLVLSPRFGGARAQAWLCPDGTALERRLEGLAFRPWFRTHGVLAQELVSPAAPAVRLVVAGDEVVGAAATAASPLARQLALRAAATVGGDFVGVTLLPTGSRSFCVLDVDAACDLREDELQPSVDALVAFVLGEAAAAAS
jgi:glutathione synthase/RimK-type ligase-like ATP-grasp enzyme